MMDDKTILFEKTSSSKGRDAAGSTHYPELAGHGDLQPGGYILCGDDEQPCAECRGDAGGACTPGLQCGQQSCSALGSSSMMSRALGRRDY